MFENFLQASLFFFALVMAAFRRFFKSLPTSENTMYELFIIFVKI